MSCFRSCDARIWAASSDARVSLHCCSVSSTRRRRSFCCRASAAVTSALVASSRARTSTADCATILRTASTSPASSATRRSSWEVLGAPRPPESPPPAPPSLPAPPLPPLPPVPRREATWRADASTSFRSLSTVLDWAVTRRVSVLQADALVAARSEVCRSSCASADTSSATRDSVFAVSACSPRSCDAASSTRMTCSPTRPNSRPCAASFWVAVVMDAAADAAESASCASFAAWLCSVLRTDMDSDVMSSSWRASRARSSATSAVAPVLPCCTDCVNASSRRCTVASVAADASTAARLSAHLPSTASTSFRSVLCARWTSWNASDAVRTWSLSCVCVAAPASATASTHEPRSVCPRRSHRPSPPRSCAMAAASSSCTSLMRPLVTATTFAVSCMCCCTACATPF